MDIQVGYWLYIKPPKVKLKHTKEKLCNITCAILPFYREKYPQLDCHLSPLKSFTFASWNHQIRFTIIQCSIKNTNLVLVNSKWVNSKCVTQIKPIPISLMRKSTPNLNLTCYTISKLSTLLVNTISLLEQII